MKPTTYKMYQYPRGVNRGGILDVDICPTISCSSWEHNCLLIEIYEAEGDIRTLTEQRQEGQGSEEKP